MLSYGNSWEMLVIYVDLGSGFGNLRFFFFLLKWCLIWRYGVLVLIFLCVFWGEGGEGAAKYFTLGR